MKELQDKLDQHINMEIPIHHKNKDIRRYNATIFAIIFLITLVRYLFPERRLLFPYLNTPKPPVGVLSGGLKYNSAPVVGATVTLYTADQLTEVAVATTDAEGKFALPEEAQGKYHVTAILKNTDGTWLQGDADVTIDGPTASVDVTME